MKHTLKKSLAILLAMLMLLGAMATGAAAATGEEPTLGAQNPIKASAANEPKLTVKTPGTAEVKLFYGHGSYHDLDYDLSGLVLEASGGGLSSPQTIDYDVAKKGDLQGDNIRWSVYSIVADWEKQQGRWVLGTNQATLYVAGYRYSGFELVDGIYGKFNNREACFEGGVSIELTGVEYAPKFDLDTRSAEELTLGQSKAVSIPRPDSIYYIDGDYYYETLGKAEERLFKFTPDESGGYVFRSGGAKYREELFTENGECRDISEIDPKGTLYDENGVWLASNEDDRGNEEHWYNFGIYYKLEAGKTYYLQTTALYGGDYTVRVDAYSKQLIAPQKEITIKYGEYISLADLLAGTTWDIGQLNVYYRGYNEDAESIRGEKPGTETLRVVAPDGEQIQIEVTVKFTFWGWIQYYLLGNWIVMLIEGRMPNGVWEKLKFALIIVLYPVWAIFAMPAGLIGWLIEMLG